MEVLNEDFLNLNPKNASYSKVTVACFFMMKRVLKLSGGECVISM